jgi:hypothetical protein
MAAPQKHARSPPIDIRTVGSACLCMLLTACAEMPAMTGTPPLPFASSDAIFPSEIGVLIAGWHTGLVLPADELGPVHPLLGSDRQARYLSFGWGNRRFYMAAHPGSGDAIAALFRSPSALFVQSAATPAGLLASDVHIHWVCADREELWRVDHYLEQSLSRPAEPVDLGPGPFPESHFYASTGHYSALHTCNTWTVAALEYAGFRVRAGGVLFASQVDARVRKLRACPAPQ